MVTGEDEELGVFGYGIKVVRRPDGRIEYQPHTVIKSIPIEIVIMQLEVFLRDLKQQYHNKHSAGSSEGRE